MTILLQEHIFVIRFATFRFEAFLFGKSPIYWTMEVIVAAQSNQQSDIGEVLSLYRIDLDKHSRQAAERNFCRLLTF